VIRALFTWLFYAVLTTIAYIVVRSLMPGRAELETDVFVLVLGAFGLFVLLSGLSSFGPAEGESKLEEALEPVEQEPVKIQELERLEREVGLAGNRAFDLHYRLRPVLTEIAEAKLERRGVRLGAENNDRARELLGDELWSFVAADREPPEDRGAPGPGIDAIERAVERLERV
jgi:hypothetical protein